ncbi:MAG: hypothetical protein KDG50_07085 [Chromatiales bacterium]|nr:hypothetical protein [Chromatiales bacterium]
MSGLLTYLSQAVVDGSVREIDGKVLSRPALLVSDGVGATYACDVDIGQVGRNAVTAEEEAVPLRNVPISTGVRELTYADVGSAVRLRRSDSGRFEIVGFSRRAPGNYTRVPVTVPEPAIGPVQYDIGAVVEIGLSTRVIPYDELQDLPGGYGAVPYGAYGIYRGSILIEIKA